MDTERTPGADGDVCSFCDRVLPAAQLDAVDFGLLRSAPVCAGCLAALRHDDPTGQDVPPTPPREPPPRRRGPRPRRVRVRRRNACDLCPVLRPHGAPRSFRAWAAEGRAWTRYTVVGVGTWVVCGACAAELLGPPAANDNATGAEGAQ